MAGGLRLLGATCAVVEVVRGIADAVRVKVEKRLAFVVDPVLVGVQPGFAALVDRAKLRYVEQAIAVFVVERGTASVCCGLALSTLGATEASE